MKILDFLLVQIMMAYTTRHKIILKLIFNLTNYIYLAMILKVALIAKTCYTHLCLQEFFPPYFKKVLDIDDDEILEKWLKMKYHFKRP